MIQTDALPSQSRLMPRLSRPAEPCPEGRVLRRLNHPGVSTQRLVLAREGEVKCRRKKTIGPMMLGGCGVRETG